MHFSMPLNSQIHKFVHEKSHTTTGESENSGFCFDFCCSINFWIGPWYASLEIDSAAREAQRLNLFSLLSQILGSCPAKTMNRFRFESGCQISELLTNYFSLMSTLGVSSSDGIEDQRKSFFSEQCGFPSSNVEINCLLCG
jgi:hypothetical protein